MRIPIYITLLLVLCSCSKKQKIEKEEFFEDRGSIFHTTYSIKYQHSKPLSTYIEEELKRFDHSLNPFDSRSIISKVNNNEEVILDSLFINVIKRSLEVSASTNGLFDITLSPLINAWGFGFKNIDNVSSESIDSLKKIVGYNKISLKNNSITKEDPRIQINTSAIAKGYSTDIIASLLRSHGVSNFMIEIGGEIHARGVNAKGRCWKIGITKPGENKIDDYEQIQSVVKLCNKSLATSGNYRNFYMKGDKKISHTIDPTTGYPSEKNVLSATVIADDCMTADAFATAFMLTDTAQTRVIAHKEKLAYMLILASGSDSLKIVQSDDFENYIVQE